MGMKHWDVRGHAEVMPEAGHNCSVFVVVGGIVAGARAGVNVDNCDLRNESLPIRFRA
jgi:hypothetical protein